VENEEEEEGSGGEGSAMDEDGEEMDFSTLKVAELRTELKNRDLSTKGKKVYARACAFHAFRMIVA
jgi:hypothetical protein